MSNDKRLRIEEYHDPDYSQFQTTKPSSSHECSDLGKTPAKCMKSDSKSKSVDDRRRSIIKIINTEFPRELNSKELELDEINRRLNEARELLAKVRYAVVHHYYMKKNLQCTQTDSQLVEQCSQESMTNHPNTSENKQTVIHPSLRKLLGKRPIDYNEILKIRPTRKAAKNATEQFHKLAKKSTNDTKGKINEPDAYGTDGDDKSGGSESVSNF